MLKLNPTRTLGSETRRWWANSRVNINKNWFKKTLSLMKLQHYYVYRKNSALRTMQQFFSLSMYKYFFKSKSSIMRVFPFPCFLFRSRILFCSDPLSYSRVCCDLFIFLHSWKTLKLKNRQNKGKSFFILCKYLLFPLSTEISCEFKVEDFAIFS